VAALTGADLRRAAAIAIGFAALLSTGRAQRATEYEVKASYIDSFPQYIEWPARAWTSADAPFRICIVGSDPFGAAIDRATRGQSVQGHRIAVERQAVDANLSRCQMVFVPSDQTARSAAILKSLNSSSVLTIGEDLEFLRAGGALAMVVDGGRVRFDINLRSADVKDLHWSSKLLRLARDVSREERTP